MKKMHKMLRKIAALCCAAVMAVPMTTVFANVADEFTDDNTSLSTPYKVGAGISVFAKENDPWKDGSFETVYFDDPSLYMGSLTEGNTGQEATSENYVEYDAGSGGFISGFTVRTFTNKWALEGSRTMFHYFVSADEENWTRLTTISDTTAATDIQTVELSAGTNPRETIRAYENVCTSVPEGMRYLKIVWPQYSSGKVPRSAVMGDITINRVYPNPTVELANPQQPVPAYGPISLKINGNMDPDTLIPENLSIAQTDVSITEVQYDGEQGVWNVLLSDSLDFVTPYTLVFSEAVKDIYGQSIQEGGREVTFITDEEPSALITNERPIFRIDTAETEVLTEGELTASWNITGNYVPGDEQKAVLMLMLYQGDKLEKITFVTDTLTQDMTKTLTTPVMQVPSLAGGEYEVHCYVWEGFDVMGGVANGVVLSQTGIREVP